MTDKARKEYTVSIELSDSADLEDEAYLALFGVINLFDQIGMNYEQKNRVIKTLAIFLDR